MDEHAAALVLYARQWCASPEDVVQEALLKLSRQTPAPEHVVAWLYRVVRNGAISELRSEQRRRRREQQVAKPVSWFEPAPLAEEVTAALATLPLEQREVVVAHLWSGLTFEQIGELIGASGSTAHRMYQAGLCALRERWHEPCPTH